MRLGNFHEKLGQAGTSMTSWETSMTNIHRYENIAAKHQDFHVAQDQFGSEESKFEVKNDLHFQFRESDY